MKPYDPHFILRDRPIPDEALEAMRRGEPIEVIDEGEPDYVVLGIVGAIVLAVFLAEVIEWIVWWVVPAMKGMP